VSDTTFTNQTTITEAEWFNEVNNLVHKIFNNPTYASQVFDIDSSGNVAMSSGNLVLGAAAAGTSAVSVLGLGNGTAPTTSPADMIQLYSKDSSDGSASLGLKTEQSVEVVGAVFTTSHKLKVWINDTEYWIALDNV